MTSTSSDTDFTLAIHGGAGTILRAKMTPEREAAYHAGLRRALDAGVRYWRTAERRIDAVTAAVMALEDEPLFNAGRGAVYTSAGKQEMDAAIMDGRDRAAGAVAGICGPRNPILAARAVMEKSDHVFLIGESALDVLPSEASPSRRRPISSPKQRWNALQETLAMRRAALRSGRIAQAWHGRRGCAGPARASGGRDFDGRHDGESAWSRRRQPGDRRGHLGG